MRNAKIELLTILEDKAKIKCASIYKEIYYEDTRQNYILKLNHSANDLEHFLNSLNFEYDSGYGGQQLFGIVWLEDGTWLSRGEYDGSEWWERNALPIIPNECK